ncbi:putative SP-containing protein [Vairimorpha necatrix]|uniref:SP-containing protein n=1 Tax=Vairimorpha necatrix TaxID=6039 RepID=A0AAX4JGS3_9MICR
MFLLYGIVGQIFYYLSYMSSTSNGNNNLVVSNVNITTKENNIIGNGVITVRPKGIARNMNPNEDKEQEIFLYNSECTIYITEEENKQQSRLYYSECIINIKNDYKMEQQNDKNNINKI